jgi:hypothetical protein
MGGILRELLTNNYPYLFMILIVYCILVIVIIKLLSLRKKRSDRKRVLDFYYNHYNNGIKLPTRSNLTDSIENLVFVTKADVVDYRTKGFEFKLNPFEIMIIIHMEEFPSEQQKELIAMAIIDVLPATCTTIGDHSCTCEIYGSFHSANFVFKRTDSHQ